MAKLKNKKNNIKSNADKLREEFYKGVAELKKLIETSREKTDAEMDKLLKAQEKTDAQMRETDERMKKTDERLAKRDTEIDKLLKAQEETSKLIKELSKNVGGVNNSLGKISEDMSVPQIEKMFKKFKINITTYHPDVRARYNGGAKVKEVDLILVGTSNNKDITIVVETKLRYKKTKEIDEFNEFLSKEFKQIFKEYEKYAVMGCVCALGYGTGLDIYAERLGLFVMKPVKGVMDIINRHDFKAKIV